MLLGPGVSPGARVVAVSAAVASPPSSDSGARVPAPAGAPGEERCLCAGVPGSPLEGAFGQDRAHLTAQVQGARDKRVGCSLFPLRPGASPFQGRTLASTSRLCRVQLTGRLPLWTELQAGCLTEHQCQANLVCWFL